MTDKPHDGFTSPHLKALFRPFSHPSDDTISKGNKITDAYIYNWDQRVSPDNHIQNAQLDFSPKQHNKGGGTCGR